MDAAPNKEPLIVDDPAVPDGQAQGGSSDTLARRTKKTIKYKWKRYWVNEGPKFVWVLIWLLGNIAYCTYTFIDWTDPNKTGVNLLGHGLAIAKSGAALIRLNSILLLLTVARNFISMARWQWPRLNYYVPFDKNIVFHRYLGGWIALCAAVHVGAHYYNFRTLVSTAEGIAFLHAKQLVDNKNLTPNEWLVAFTTLPGTTGILLILFMVLMYTAAVASMRRTSFELFWYTHLIVFLLFIFLNIIHGLGNIFSPAQFWMWIIAPIVIYGIERTIRFFRSRQKTIILQAIMHPANVMELRMKKLTFNFQPGMYLNLTVPYLSKFEDHPFTISSAPEQDYVSVHIQAVGDWTKGLVKMLNPEGKLGLVQQNLTHGPDGNPIIMVDGPYGAASEEVFDKKIVVLIGAGIGVTPFASVLQSIRYRLHLMQQNSPGARQIPVQKVYFFWISRDKSAFEWISTILLELEKSPFGKYLDLRIYLTGRFEASAVKSIMVADTNSATDAITGLNSRTRYGRPNWNAIFPELAQNHPGQDIDVFFCGPPILSKTLYQKCRKFTRPDGTKFQYHKENF